MAIKVNGTTVIDDSRNLVNIASGAGSSTTHGDVGTYAFMNAITSGAAWGNTRAGSSLNPAAISHGGIGLTDFYSSSMAALGGSNLQSGTWRQMGDQRGGYGSSNHLTLWVRIS